MDTPLATNPMRSVVVEACAGSGKTWLLTARVVRALLEGASPGGILALTFTDKAAAEMRSRIREALLSLCHMPPSSLRAVLSDYGLSGEALERAMASAPQAYERLLVADQQPTIGTFHAWYAQLLSYAPSPMASLATLGLAPYPSMVRAEAWASFVATTAADPRHPLAQLAEHLGFDTARQAVLSAAVDWRAALQVDADPSGEDLLTAKAQAHDALVQWVSQTADTAEALAPFFQELPKRDAHAQALAAWRQSDARALATLFLRDAPEGQARQIIKHRFVRKADRTAWGRQAIDIEQGIVRLVESLNDALEQADRRIQAARHRMLCRASLAWQDHWAGWVARTGETDYDGLESAVVRLMASDQAPALLSRLDCRYEQILVDEFQDTNPVQWGLLRAWLEPHVGAEGVMPGAPKVFMVGDPKQSIYRFRGADPKVFIAAREWLVTHYCAARIETDTTRRCAPEVVNFMNGALPEWGGDRYRTHSSHSLALPGCVAHLPMPESMADEGDEEGHEEEAEGATAGGCEATRDWLALPERPRRPSAWRAEGLRIAEAILACRAANPWLDWGGIRILTRGRTHMAAYEEALSLHGIPYQSDRRGGLLEQSEVQDILALCRWLAHPWSNADLAHVLRSPFFSATDASLLQLAAAAQRGSQRWWETLQALPATADPCLAGVAERLATWRSWMSSLPVHDLLDRILADAGLWNRLLAYGPQRVEQVRANIESLLALSLEWDAGRSPSLARFVQDMSALLARADQEAPAVVQASCGPSAVQIQTLHAAKGLEADLIILAGLTDVGGQDKGIHWLAEFTADRSQLVGVSTWRKGDANTPEVLHRREEQLGLAQEEAFNLFYVAITRARRMLLLSAAKASESHWFGRVITQCDAWTGKAPVLPPPSSDRPA
ncbi:MAG: UvrD-helicase domain-containing protein [Burkholderiaceae bacterium]